MAKCTTIPLFSQCATGKVSLPWSLWGYVLQRPRFIKLFAGTDSQTSRLDYWARPSIIMAGALLIRVVWTACVPVVPVSDGVLYDAFAQSMVAGHGYAFADGTMTEYWPFGTSAIYALLYYIFGVHTWVVPDFQALLGTTIVGLTWRLSYNALGPKVAALAAWLTAGWPLLVEFTTIYASELLFIALVLTALNIWIWRRLPFAVRMIFWGGVLPRQRTFVRRPYRSYIFFWRRSGW